MKLILTNQLHSAAFFMSFFGVFSDFWRLLFFVSDGFFRFLSSFFLRFKSEGVFADFGNHTRKRGFS